MGYSTPWTDDEIASAIEALRRSTSLDDALPKMPRAIGARALRQEFQRRGLQPPGSYLGVVLPPPVAPAAQPPEQRQQPWRYPGRTPLAVPPDPIAESGSGHAPPPPPQQCKKHPQYQAKRPPLADCEPCRAMWRHAQDNPGGTTWGKETRAQRQQEYNRRMGVTADVLGDIARGAEPATEDQFTAAQYISALATEEEQYINRQRARSVSIGVARETLFLRNLRGLIATMPAVVPVGYAAQPSTRGEGKRIVNLLTSDLHFGANLDGRELPIEYTAITEARRFARVIAETRDYKPHYREQTHLNLLAIGDLIEGLLLHDLRDGDPLTDQFYACMWLYIQAIGLLAASFPTVTVHWVPGNHGRNKLRHQGRATSSKWDGFETMIGLAVQAACRELRNVSWNIPMRPFVAVDLFGKWLFATHGDTLLNVGSPSKSLDIGRIAAKMNEINATGSYGHHFDVFAVGHVHTAVHTSLPGGELIINPALVPPNGYARDFTADAQCGQFLWESVPGYPVGDVRLIRVGVSDDNDASLDELIQPARFSGEAA